MSLSTALGVRGVLAALLTAAPVLPRAAGRFSPSRAELAGAGNARTADLSDVETCATCHADAAAQWRQSAHAFASFNNPIYRLTVDRLRNDVGKDASRFCAGCHDVALLFDGSMSREVRPDDPRAQAGVTCRTCHGIEDTSPDGNGSYRLSTSEVPLPSKAEPGSLERHRARVALKPLRTAALCGSCHRAFLDIDTGNRTHLAGMDDFTAWSQSAYAGSLAERVDPGVAPADCRGCHMPREAATHGDVSAHGGTIASHRFLGGHTWLYAMEGDPALLRRGQDFLKGAVSVDFGAAASDDGARVLLATGAPLREGHSLTLDVVVRNTRVGHRFPGGTLDAQDSWLDVELRDASGALIASSAGDDVHRFRALALGDDGKPLLERQTHLFRTMAFNQTLGPRDATVVSFRFEASATALQGAHAPFRAVARVLHRSRNLELQRAACDESKTARARQFASAAATWGAPSLDVCAPQPITELARAEVWLGEGSGGRPSLPTRLSSERLEEHGLGMLRAVQERLDEARPSLSAALEAMDPRQLAAPLCTLAQVASRQGRVEEALELLDRAERLTPSHPALARARGEALSQVWRWREAIVPLARAAQLTPADVTGWRELALAQASAGDEPGALASAQRGLALQPRDPDLLRLQALSLPALGADEQTAASALDAYLSYRAADDAPRLRSACSNFVPGCALERLPVHEHPLVPVRVAP